MEGLTFEVLQQAGSFWLVVFSFYYYVTSLSKHMQGTNEALSKINESLVVLLDRAKKE